MSYKKLNINRTLIAQILSENVESLAEPVEKGNNEVHFRATMPDGKDVFLIFYFNKDGTTSISPREPNLEVGNQLAELIATNGVYSDKGNIELFIHLDENDYATILDYLTSECGAEETENKNISGGKQVKLTGKCGNQLVIKYFTKKANMQIQGKPLSLYEDLIEILCELLPYEEFVNSQLKQIKVELEPAVVKGELESRLSHSYDFLGDKVGAILSPSLALNKLDIKLDDYTPVAMPVLRGLEGYVKLLFKGNGYIIDKNFGTVIDGNGGEPFVLDTVKTQINCTYTVSAIEQCYAYWTQQRHGLFHVDGTVDSTRTINKAEADQIIKDSLALIEDTFTAIPN